MSYTCCETETEEEHGDNPDQEVGYEEMLVDAGVLTEDETAVGKARLASKRAVAAVTVMQMVVCSCGSPKCGMIRKFGLVRPKFEEHIQPIYCQMTRDRTALSIKNGN